MGTTTKQLASACLAVLLGACTIEIGNPNGGSGIGPTGPGGGYSADGKLTDGDWGITVGEARLDYIEHLQRGPDQYQNFCSQGMTNRFTDWYCAGGTAPSITGLEDVLVGLGLKNAGQPDTLPNNTLFAITSHSSSLVTRHTSVLNPRAIVFTRDGSVTDYAAVGFIRGDGFAEVAAFDTATNDVDLILVSFKRACDPDCTNAEKFLPENESGWQDVAVYSDKDLANTVFDCLQCHEPQGAGTGKILRMQELVNPWTHWFRDNRGTADLLTQFQTYHVNESYAGIPANQIANSDPRDLEDLVENAGFQNQPNLFRGNNINNDDITVTDPNNTWLGLYQNAVDGTMIAPPYFGINPYDEAKVTAAGDLYKSIVDGTTSRDQMPDMVDLFRDDALPYMSHAAAPGLDALGIIQHKCGTCHDGRFPGVSRDNFRISAFPDGLAPIMKQRIAARITLPDYSRLRMPPKQFADLTDEEIQTILDAVKK